MKTSCYRAVTDIEHKPALYLRYVDDIFCVFRSQIQFEQFWNGLNNLHRNLRFTFELGPKTLPFLDTSVSVPSIEDGCFTSEIYRKPTFTGLLLNAKAMCPQKWKTGLVHCLLHRAYTVCSDWCIFAKEVTFLEDLFSKNGYSIEFFNSCVNRFLNSKFLIRSDSSPTEEKVETLFFIPYVGLPSIKFAGKIRQIFKRQSGIDIKVIFTTFKVKNYFSLKCPTPFSLKAKVIYKFNCLCDTDISYIGKTKRHLATRVGEHKSQPSAIRQHLQSCETCHSNFGLDCFSIVDKGKSDFDCGIKEAIYIKTHQPCLNKQLFTSGTQFKLNIFN